MGNARSGGERRAASGAGGDGWPPGGRSRRWWRAAVVLLFSLPAVCPGRADASPLPAPDLLGSTVSATLALFLAPQALEAPSDLWAGAISPSAVQLNWIDHSDNETGFEIQRKVGAGDWAPAGTAPARATQFVDPTVSPDILYTYRVRAVNDQSVSEWSNEAMITVPRLPSTPSSLAATALAATRVQLSWVDTVESGDFYTIWRQKLAPSGETDFSRIGLVPAPQTSFFDETVDPSSRYAYRVRAETTSFGSDWSSPASAATPAAPAGVSVGAGVPPIAAAGADTRVTLDARLPDGYRLERNPYIVVVDPAGSLFEFFPVFVTQPLPNAQGYRDLHTELYLPGLYQLRAQLYLIDPSGLPAGAASPWMPMVVPPPVLASLTLASSEVEAGQPAGGTVQLAGGRRIPDAVVVLSSSNPAVAALPATITLHPWDATASFAITTGAVSVPTTVTITASWNGISRSAPLVVTPAAGGVPAL